MDLYLVVIVLTLPSLVRGVPIKGTCDYPQKFSTGDLTAEKFKINTKVTYNCDAGYFSHFSASVYYNCVNSSGTIKWQTEELNEQCLDNDLIKTNNDLGGLNSTSDSDLTSNVTRAMQSDHCGPPPPVPNGKLDLLNSEYVLGQEFYYSLHGNSDVQDGCHGVLKCMNCNGHATWVNLTDGCSINIHGPPKTETTIRTDIHGPPKTETTIRTAVCITLGVIFVIMLIFLLSYYGKKQWEKRSWKSRTIQRNVASEYTEDHKMNALLSEKQL
ncbi:uncharacterized protein LOC142149990 isoform X2 [Mixophyes fleayi]|uniref:uncharacterized protein LOC142149990 isoform X2 n=1 Tax=Mixophyes fleayi TaxID=3061075 RepID=UPI003F4DFF30